MRSVCSPGRGKLSRPCTYLYCAYLDLRSCPPRTRNSQASFTKRTVVFELAGFTSIDDRDTGGVGANAHGACLELDPLNFDFLHKFNELREATRFPRVAAILDRALSIVPNDVGGA